MILTITLNPSVDRTVFVEGLKPHDTNRIVGTETDAGGKGINLSRIVREFGVATRCTGFLGGAPGAFIKAVLVREDVPFDFVAIHEDTRVNFSVEDGSGEPPTTFNERGPRIHEGEWSQLLERIRELAPRGGWACLGGSIPPGLEPSVYRDLTTRLKALGCHVSVDADGDALRLALEAEPDLIKPNRGEAERLLGTELESLKAAAEAARELHAKGIAHALISLGEDGAVAALEEGVFLAESPKITPRSTIGSGDSLIGGYLSTWTRTQKGDESLRWGVAAGAATAASSGSDIGRIALIRQLAEHVKIWRA